MLRDAKGCWDAKGFWDAKRCWDAKDAIATLRPAEENGKQRKCVRSKCVPAHASICYKSRRLADDPGPEGPWLGREAA